MNFTIDSFLSIASLLLGGGGIGAFFTWRYVRREAKAKAETEEVNMAKAVQDTYQEMMKDKETEVLDKNRIIAELREDRDRYKQDRNELREQIQKLSADVADLKVKQTKQEQQIEMMRPFVCTDVSCQNRKCAPILQAATQK